MGAGGRSNGTGGGPTPLRIALVLAPLAALVVGAIWLGARDPGAPEAGAPDGGSAGAAGAGATGPGLDEDAVDAVVRATREYLTREETGRAVTVIEAAVEREPTEPRLRPAYAEALYASGRTEEALEQYRTLCVWDDRAEYRDFAALLAKEAGFPEEAVEHYRAAQRLDPSNPKYPLYRAQIERSLGRPDEARSSLAFALRLDPELAVAYASLAGISLDQNHADAALSHVRRAREIDPDEISFRVIEARALRRVGRAEEAANLLLALPAATRDADPGLLGELAMCLGLLGEPGRAAEEYARASDANPGDATLAYEAAVWLDRAGEGARAIGFASRAASRGHTPARALLERLEGRVGAADADR